MEQTLKSQELVDVQEIRNGVVYLKDKTLCTLLTISGINFDLKSEPEKEQILGSFQNFLNTLDFPIQFFIHSRKTNVSRYLELIEKRRLEERNELLKIQINEYSAFIQSFIEQNPIITKTFFVVVRYVPPFAAVEAGGLLKIFSSFGSKKEEIAKQEAEGVEESVRQLKFRTEQVIDGLSTIGLKAVSLESEELIELFYNLYNPELTDKQDLAIAKEVVGKTETKDA